MEQSELLRRIVGVLEELGLPYLVTGSTATIFCGEPRFTADVCLRLSLAARDNDGLLESFERRSQNA